MNKELFSLWQDIDENTFFIEESNEKFYKKDIDEKIYKLEENLKNISFWENRKVYLDVKDKNLFIITFLTLLKLKSKAVLVPNEIKVEDYNYKGGIFLSDNKLFENVITLKKDLQVLPHENFDATSLEPPDRNNNVLYLYTSGSTGKAKLIPKTSSNLIYEVEELSKIFTVTKNDLFYCTPPIYHIYGFLNGFLLPVYSSAKMIIDDHFTPESIAQFVENRRITNFVSIPTYYRMFSELELIDNFKHCQKLASSSAPLPLDVSKSFFNKGKRITEIYGSTETGGIAHRVSAESIEWKLYSYVKILEEWDNYINNQNIIDTDEEKEFKIISPAISINYNKKNGFNTGDIVSFTKNGNFILRGRNIRFVKIAGKRVDLQYVLEKVKEYFIKECNLEIKDEELYLGEKNEKIYLIFEKSLPKSTKEIKNDLNKHLPSYAVPRILISGIIPRNNMGKINKIEIEKIIKKEEKN